MMTMPFEVRELPREPGIERWQVTPHWDDDPDDGHPAEKGQPPGITMVDFTVNWPPETAERWRDLMDRFRREAEWRDQQPAK